MSTSKQNEIRTALGRADLSSELLRENHVYE